MSYKTTLPCGGINVVCIRASWVSSPDRQPLIFLTGKRRTKGERQASGQLHTVFHFIPILLQKSTLENYRTRNTGPFSLFYGKRSQNYKESLKTGLEEKQWAHEEDTNQGRLKLYNCYTSIRKHRFVFILMATDWWRWIKWPSSLNSLVLLLATSFRKNALGQLLCRQLFCSF